MTAAVKTETAAKPAPKAKAPAKKAAAKAATPATRLKWVVEGGDRTLAGKVGQTASLNGVDYAIEKAGEKWTATVTADGKPEVLVADASFAACYRACVDRARA